MSTSFDPFSGVNGRVKAVAITPDLNTDIVTSSGTTTAWLEKTAWKINRKATGPKIYTANNTADAQGSIGPKLLRGAILEHTISLKGIYNGGTTTTDARFKEGSFVKMDLIFHATYALGYYALLCRVTSFATGPQIGPNATEVEIELEVEGLIPAPSTS